MPAHCGADLKCAPVALQTKKRKQTEFAELGDKTVNKFGSGFTGLAAGLHDETPFPSRGMEKKAKPEGAMVEFGLGSLFCNREALLLKIKAIDRIEEGSTKKIARLAREG
jgi:hypothetical protein